MGLRCRVNTLSGFRASGSSGSGNDVSNPNSSPSSSSATYLKAIRGASGPSPAGTITSLRDRSEVLGGAERTRERLERRVLTDGSDRLVVFATCRVLIAWATSVSRSATRSRSARDLPCRRGGLLHDGAHCALGNGSRDDPRFASCLAACPSNECPLKQEQSACRRIAVETLIPTLAPKSLPAAASNHAPQRVRQSTHDATPRAIHRHRIRYSELGRGCSGVRWQGVEPRGLTRRPIDAGAAEGPASQLGHPDARAMTPTQQVRPPSPAVQRSAGRIRG